MQLRHHIELLRRLGIHPAHAQPQQHADGAQTLTHSGGVWSSAVFNYNYPGSGAPLHCAAVASVPFQWQLSCIFSGGSYIWQLQLINLTSLTGTCPNVGGTHTVTCTYTQANGQITSVSCSPFQITAAPVTASACDPGGDTITITP